MDEDAEARKARRKAEKLAAKEAKAARVAGKAAKQAKAAAATQEGGSTRRAKQKAEAEAKRVRHVLPTTFKLHFTRAGSRG